MDSYTGSETHFRLKIDDSLTYTEALDQVRPDYVQYAKPSVDASLAKGEQFNVQYPIVEKGEAKER